MVQGMKPFIFTKSRVDVANILIGLIAPLVVAVLPAIASGVLFKWAHFPMPAWWNDVQSGSIALVFVVSMLGAGLVVSGAVGFCETRGRLGVAGLIFLASVCLASSWGIFRIAEYLHEACSHKLV